MTTLHQLPRIINRLEPARPAFVTSAGAIYRRAAQGGIRRVTPLDLVLMSVSEPPAFWCIEARRQEG